MIFSLNSLLSSCLQNFSSIVARALPEEGLFHSPGTTSSIWAYQALPGQSCQAGPCQLGHILGHCTSPVCTLIFMYFPYPITKHHACGRYITSFCPGRWRMSLPWQKGGVFTSGLRTKHHSYRPTLAFPATTSRTEGYKTSIPRPYSLQVASHGKKINK